MKSRFLLITCIYFFGFNLLFGSNPPSNTDKINSIKNEISNELNELDELDSFIGTDYDFDKLQAEQPEMVEKAGLKSGSSFENLVKADGPPLGIPGFLWGFCLGLIGILIVYLVMSDAPDRKKHVTSALYGCLAWTILYLILISTGVINLGVVEPKNIEEAINIINIA